MNWTPSPPPPDVVRTTDGVTVRRIYRTAQIKPATRDAIKDVLAQAADEIIALRMKLADVKPPLWARFFRGALTLWTGA